MDFGNENLNGYSERLLNEGMWLALGEGIIKIILILLISRLIISLGKKMISKFFLVRLKSPIRVSERREATLVRLLENILTYVVYFIALITILEVCGIEVKALLAGAGVIGLAIGFGAQSLVKDIITGFFIVFEDQFSVGDYVKIATYEGEVIEIGLRTTKIKCDTGEIHILPNGTIAQVTNYSILNSMALIDLSIPNDGSVDQAEKVLNEELEGMEERIEGLVHSPKVLGIQEVNADEIILRIAAETKPRMSREIDRLLQKELKIILDRAGIQATSKAVSGA
ncbi:mechanosensitive ion channel family protein [Bacillus massiliglaciei]|uniref:mechanosensitive ion channel family protein n=1 Tax=Bacillus massiliglaciei TaxID=1816693 RepID=UPI000AD948B5|nr:mechanosensitive ion channel family protein [Bacillus massiliglaciei]